VLSTGVTWERIAEVFAAALDHPPYERETFLSSACGENSALATEVRSLLENHGIAGNFLQPGSVALGSPLSPSLLSAIEQAAPSFAQFAPEALIGSRYRVKALLGRGGAGEVYEAWDEELAIPVALKSLRFEVGRHIDALRSLKQEAMLARSVVHPNVCRVYDLGCHGDPKDGIWFLTMEVLRGETLAERLRGGRLTPEEAWPFVEHMVAGLEAAHQAGVVHLDFKSGNVMLVGESGREQAVITDFGLARALRQDGEDRPRTECGSKVIIGTPAYMAPEQVRGEVAGPAADMYALGIVLYEMVTGTLPFAGDTELEVAERRLDAEAPSPLSVVPELDERWEAVIGRCLERDPRRRFARAGDVAEVLAGRRSAQLDPIEGSIPSQHSLPAERDRFVGRDGELAALERTIAGEARIVTLLGAGGMGKTRLAVRYGWLSLADWPGGVWFCDLTEARDMNGITSAVGSSLGVPLGKGDPVVQLGHVLAGRGRCLMILDNLEQVAEPGAVTVQRWLEAAPEVQFLVTSRERLSLASAILEVGPMGVESGLELFIERARRLCPGLDLGEVDLAAAQEVVRLVEGMPLAIELGAVRMRVMDAVQLVSGMRKRFSLLTGGRSERHETLTAVIDGSWELLEPWEKAALAQCAVFDGGFTLEAAESVLDLSAYPEAPWTVDVVQSLTDQSLLRTWVPEGTTGVWLPAPRFGMYVSVQEYARRKLAEAGTILHVEGDVSAVRTAEERHGKWYGRFGTEEALATFDQHGGVERRRALGNDIDNLVAASRRAVARGDSKTATAAYRAAWVVHSMRGPYGTSVELGLEILAAPAQERERALTLTTLGQAEKSLGRMQEAGARLEAALELTRKEGNIRGAGIILGHLGGLCCDEGREEEARGYFDAALTIHRAVGDRHGEGIVLGNQGTLHRLEGRMDDARRCYEAALAIHREVGNRRSEGIALGNLAALDQEQGLAEPSRVHYEAALTIHRELGDRRWEGAVMGNLGNLYFVGGQLDEALALFEAALTIHREVGNRRSEGIVLGNLAGIDQARGRVEDARHRSETALAIHREVGNRRLEGIELGHLGNFLRIQGHVKEARDRFEAALAIHREVSDLSNEGIALADLAILEQQDGRMEKANEQYKAALAILREVGNQCWQGIVLGHIGNLRYRQGRIAEAQDALTRGEVLLRATEAHVGLASLLCIRAELESGIGNMPHAQMIFAEVEKLATRFGSGADSELGHTIAKLRQTLRLSSG
jgi:predicted ATPase/Tfp pilus assembly protein PilF